MSIPELATREVAAFCAGRVPADLREQIKLEFSVRGNSITIVERRPPWRPDLGSEWSAAKVAQLRHDPAAGSWTLHCCDSRRRWFPYDDVRPSSDVGPLLAEIDADPTGLFWG